MGTSPNCAAVVVLGPPEVIIAATGSADCLDSRLFLEFEGEAGADATGTEDNAGSVGGKPVDIAIDSSEICLGSSSSGPGAAGAGLRLCLTAKLVLLPGIEAPG
jgi:hypothetical protein